MKARLPRHGRRPAKHKSDAPPSTENAGADAGASRGA